MCGIIGWFLPKNSNIDIDPEILIKMRDRMIHRGPDDEGIWISPDKKCGLGHRRLSIIDLSRAGLQPMSNKDGTIWITFNGEIYNFQEITDELKDKGYIFKSKTDTECIIYAYEEWGIDCIHRFNGMWAFALYDMRRMSKNTYK